jgi:hypothetical protein
VDHTSRFGDVLVNTPKVIFEAHSMLRDPLGGPFCPIDA